jgi:hypothetical protein
MMIRLKQVCPICLYMVGFIDDTSGSMNKCHSNSTPTPEGLAQLMNPDAQLWNDLLHNPGGALELLKCSYPMMYYKFTHSTEPRWPHRLPNITKVASGNHSKSHKFKSLAAYTSLKTLGVHKEPSGSQISALVAITKNSEANPPSSPASPSITSKAELSTT